MPQFVCVRLVQGNGLDLSLFQFDYDLTFAAFFLNPDLTIYGRFGTRSSDKRAADDISLEGFRKAMLGALELHRGYPANKAVLAGKRGPRPRYPHPEDYPMLQGKYTASLDYTNKPAASCIHCHQVREAERVFLRKGGEPPPAAIVRPWPMPDVLGLHFDPLEKATVKEVQPDSSAGRDGFRAGDELLTLEGQPLLSTADVQWVMEQAPEPARLQARVRRGGQTLELGLNLAKDWRKGSEVSWRPSTWDLRRMATGGLVLADANPEERRAAGLSSDQLALRVHYVGQYGEHAVGKKAGFEKDDLIVGVDGRSSRMSETDWIEAMLKRPAGSKVPVEIVRGGNRVSLVLPLQ